MKVCLMKDAYASKVLTVTCLFPYYLDKYRSCNDDVSTIKRQLVTPVLKKRNHRQPRANMILHTMNANADSETFQSGKIHINYLMNHPWTIVSFVNILFTLFFFNLYKNSILRVTESGANVRSQ